MGCWRWFSTVLKEAGVTVNAQNQELVENVVHQFIGANTQYQQCSSDWRSAAKVMKDPSERQKLVAALKAIK